MNVSTPTAGESGNSSESYRLPLIALTSLFFMWGFITCLNDILIPHLKAIFELSYFQAMAVNFAFFGAYALVSYPAGKLVKRVGYQKGIVIGLSIAGLGCLMFVPAASMQVYGVFLLALFILASGITILQVSANPYVSRLGAARSASSRLTLTQAFNSLGTTLAPYFGAVMILSVATYSASELAVMTAEQLSAYKIEQADAIQIPYFILAAALFVLAIMFKFFKLPVIEEDEGAQQEVSTAELLGHKHLALGVLAIFVYVGAEVSIGSFLVNFFADPAIAGFEEAKAAQYVAYYWGGAMIGRFIGAWLMLRVEAGRLLAFNGIMAVLAILLTIVSSGELAMWAILSVGFFNSIMFPTIFTLAIQKLGPSTGGGSGLLCVAIVGGAIIPLIQGFLADTIGIQLAFFLPLVCYLYIAYYGFIGSKVVEN